MNSVYRITPLGPKAHKWIEKNLIREEWNDGYCVSVEWRYIEAIYDAMLESGLKNKIDFIVC